MHSKVLYDRFCGVDEMIALPSPKPAEFLRPIPIRGQ